MNQVADMLKLAFDAQQQHVDAVLATVVRTEGSAYRKPGAMMLICADGRSVGMISGGCLEPYIIKRAFWLTRNGASVQVYQTGDEQDDGIEDELSKDSIYYSDTDLSDELNFGLGCNGKVHVLFERLSFSMSYLETIRQVRQQQKPVTIATLIRSNRSEMTVGTRLNLSDSIFNKSLHTSLDRNFDRNLDRNFDKNNALSPIPPQIIKALASYKISQKNADYLILNDSILNSDNSIANVQTEWLVQRLQPQIRLLICGAGNDVMPLVTMAKLQDWHVTVIDSRSQYATRSRFPQADAVFCVSLEDSETLLNLSKNAAVALMSHSLSQDRVRLATLLAHSNHYYYLGQLGPRYRTERLIKEISAVCDHPATLATGINQLHYPIGYKLGGDGPEALALSIIAQISAVMHEQSAVITELAQPKASSSNTA